jgi:thiamine transporter ThiT
MVFKKKILFTIAFVVGFDVIASLASRVLQFEYISLVLVSLLIYLVAGYWGAHRQGFLFGILLGVLAGLTDATLGWWLSTMIRPFSNMPVASLSLSLQLIILIVVTPLALGFALVGAGICRILGQTKTA